jgi:hypothetical protein
MKRFLAVDGTPLGDSHPNAPQLFSQQFPSAHAPCGDLISCYETLRLLPATCWPHSVVLDEVTRTLLSELRSHACIGEVVLLALEVTREAAD